MAKASRTINESNRSLSQYLEEIGKFEPLHPSREVELAQAIKKGDRFAMKEFNFTRRPETLSIDEFAKLL